MSWLRFTKKIRKIVSNGPLVVQKDKLFYFSSSTSEKIELFSQEQYDDLFSDECAKSFQNNILLTNNKAEMIIEEVNRHAFRPRSFIDRINEYVEESDQSYFDEIVVDEPSLLFLICFFEQNNLTRYSFMNYYLKHDFFDYHPEERGVSFLKDLLIRTTGIFHCLCVSRVNKGHLNNINTVIDRCNSILLFLSMNHNLSLQIMNKETSDLVRTRIILNSSHFVPIIKCKDKFIINKYIQAVSTDSGDIKYLFWYQILERISQKMAPGLLITEARKIMVFANKKTDFEKFTKIQSFFKDDGELTVLNKLILSCVDKSLIKSSLKESQIDYYKTKVPRFINSDCALINFDDSSKFSLTVSNRIYRVRNAIVHSKEENFKKKGKETPFDWTKDIGLLNEELPLLKTVVDLSIKAYSSSKYNV